MHDFTDTSATALGALLCFVWGAFLLGWLIHRSRIVSDTVQWFRKASVLCRIVVTLGVAGLVAYGGSKGGGNLSSPPLLLQRVESPAEPVIAPVSVYTNDVVFRAESTNAVEATAFRRIGGTELGDWIDADAPFFSIGTNPVSRCYVSASGSVSFESMRRPPVGSPLPDGTGLPALCPLRAPLGMVPEANWGVADAQSRFWHDALPGGGRVLTWEDALMDRLPGRRVSLQVELHPSGDSVFRYDFHDALDPPATNFTIGAQMGTNGVNALSILGTNVLAATVWNVEGEPVTNGVSIADLLCTNGVFRTPASFEIRWRNTTGLDPNADTDEDGLTDWSETFLWGTDPNVADTDGDGIADNVELMMGMNPYDADEDADGIPDGMSESEWLANPLWAANSTNGVNAVVTLLQSVSKTASLVIGDLSIPLRTAGQWNLSIPRGQIVQFRLHTDGEPVSLTLTPPVHGGTRGPLLLGAADTTDGDGMWADDKDGVFDGTAKEKGTGRIALLQLGLTWFDREDGSHWCSQDATLCVHGRYDPIFNWEMEPDLKADPNITVSLDGFDDMEEALSLQVDSGMVATGTVSVENLLWGHASATVTAHRFDATAEHPICPHCGCYLPLDARVTATKTTLTLKHDNQTSFSIEHPASPEIAYSGEYFEIRRSGDDTWHSLDDSTWTARLAGEFEVRGLASAAGHAVETAPILVEVQFPSETEMMNDPQIVSFAYDLWTNTLAHCTSTSRIERGFWIGLDTLTDSYIHTEEQHSDSVDNFTDPDIDLTPVPGDSLGNPVLPHGYRVYTVASLHAHTPMQYIPAIDRDVGPSRMDRRASEYFQMPGLVYDYEEHPAGSGVIPGGHPTGAPAMLYPTGACLRRPHK